MSGSYLGIDIGTSGVRAAAFNAHGSLVSLARREYALLTPEHGAAELDPREVLAALLSALGECASTCGPVRSASFSSIMHSLIPCSQDGAPLSNALTWADTRAQSQAAALRSLPGISALCRDTGCRLTSPAYPVGKLLWLKDVKPELYERAASWKTLKQYIINELFGEDLIDCSDASSTGLYSLTARSWNAHALSLAGLSPTSLGTVVGCSHRLPALRPKYASATDLPERTPFFIGSTDGLCAHIGCGAFRPSMMSSTIGTSGALRVITPEIPPYSGHELWTYALSGDAFVSGGAINNAGLTLRWLRDTFSSALVNPDGLSPYALFDRYAQEIAPGCEGLTFIPTFLGERAPDWNTSLSASMHGLRLDHDLRHIARACMEGVIYRLYGIFSLLVERNPSIDTVIANGGYHRSAPWLQMQADMFGRAISAAGEGEAALLGAAYLAMTAIDDFDFGQSLPATTPVRVYEPNPDGTEAMRDGYMRYRELYDKLHTQRSEDI